MWRKDVAFGGDTAELHPSRIQIQQPPQILSRRSTQQQVNGVSSHPSLFQLQLICFQILYTRFIVLGQDITFTIHSSNSRIPYKGGERQASGNYSDTATAMVPNSGRGSASRNDPRNPNQLRLGIATGRVVPVAVGGRWTVVQRGTEERRIGLDGSFEAIREAIRCAFGLKTRQEFSLEDEYGIMRPLDRTMPSGTYTLVVNPGVIMSFCYAKDPNHTECKVYTKTLATQDDLSEFLEKNGWIGLISRGDDENEIIDIMDDLQHDVVYHGLNKM
ncbi:hypothetical protein POM88_051182 [Heracleum sosnowskyi]|uniref:GT-1/4-like C-terminal domain-containing protein n=1 Tax=Heracleum sosnowskyi TaxID=360622 RepID=A0AAD8H1S5_9APIA|nr:hypothetical protein POM88_051182 [Heracleum sosnowskyi]